MLQDKNNICIFILSVQTDLGRLVSVLRSILFVIVSMFFVPSFIQFRKEILYLNIILHMCIIDEYLLKSLGASVINFFHFKIKIQNK